MSVTEYTINKTLELLQDLKDDTPDWNGLEYYLVRCGAYSTNRTSYILTATISFGDEELVITCLKEPIKRLKFPQTIRTHKDWHIYSYVKIKDIEGYSETYRIIHKGDKLALN